MKIWDVRKSYEIKPKICSLLDSPNLGEYKKEREREARLGTKLLVQEKHTEVELTQERVEKNCKNTATLLKFIPCRESLNNQNIQEWMNQDKNS